MAAHPVAIRAGRLLGSLYNLPLRPRLPAGVGLPDSQRPNSQSGSRADRDQHGRRWNSLVWHHADHCGALHGCPCQLSSRNLVYPITNGLVIPVGVLLGVWILKQKIYVRTIAGMGMAVIALVLLSIG